MPSTKADPRFPVALLGATGTVGQRFVSLLDGHPLFRLESLLASERSAGKPYAEAAPWIQASPMPPGIAARTLLGPGAELDAPLVFSALDASVAGPIEERCARAGALVVSNAKSHRMHPQVPLIVPEVNPDHLALARKQDFGAGAILTNPNCSTIGLTLALAPVHRAFGLERVHVVSLQALSGAGLPGIASYRSTDNVIPWIEGEEEKLGSETQKILGSMQGDSIEPAPVLVSAQCNRVPVVDGHTLCVSFSTREPASEEDLRAAWESFRGEPQTLQLPSAPERPTRYLDAPDAPQPRLHRELDRGMAACIGRLRPCELLDWKLVTLSHNTLRGAAGGALLLAELAHAKGLLG